ncbi:MAG: thioredoxin domain-containing protein [Synergistaceae bacterium]|nr:thioredoxin domain-containing protein [Synergistaceae bacterium]
MQYKNSLLQELGPLSAYGEYTEQALQAQAAKKFVPVNHLAGELSPYLQAHAKNLIGWYTWGAEAFNDAKREDRPIFLSIGYYSSHWCSVMERDCFNDPEVAGFMNDTCIPVKVDREERPDLDNLYMEICRIQNGSAGWPLNIFMTPEGWPFFCTTWLPKRTRGQVPGMTEILPRIKWLWHMQRDDCERTANDLRELVNEKFNLRSGGKIRRYTAFEALDQMRKSFDIRFGGFNHMPKYPEINKLIFLLRMAADENASKRDKSDAFTMVDITLRRMWRGGIHDHLGGGFALYSTDERWHVPHFEKLLCDQAMILLAASLAQEQNANSFHRLIAEDIIFCMGKYFSDNASYSQGFKSAINSDNKDGEGRYYMWTEDEIKASLPEGLAGLFSAAYGVLPGGNFGSELAGTQIGENILYEASTVSELARRYGLKGAEVAQNISECRRILLESRDKRQLLTDDKILMDWNGLIIGALSRASCAFDQPEWKDLAERTALFCVKTFADKSGKWSRRWIAGKTGIDANAADYVYLLWGIMELYKAAKKFNAGEKQLNDWLKNAQNLADSLIKNFWDEKNGGLFLMNDSNISMRMKSGQDINNLPSANAFAITALNELAHALEDKNYSDYAAKIISCFAREAALNPLNYISLINAGLDFTPFKPVKKEEPVKVIPTDEELNREEEPEIKPDDKKESKSADKPNRTERRTRRTERSQAHRPERRTRRER